MKAMKIKTNAYMMFVVEEENGRIRVLSDSMDEDIRELSIFDIEDISSWEVFETEKSFEDWVLSEVAGCENWSQADIEILEEGEIDC